MTSEAKLFEMSLRIKGRIASASCMEVLVYRNTHGVGCCLPSSIKAIRIWQDSPGAVMGIYDEESTMSQIAEDLKFFLARS